jgi:AcrR family transcriptional regulator
MSTKREQIVTAALKLFCENGFQQTSTANISRAAGVATGTLFLYFKSKDELINALYKECKGQMAESFTKDLPVNEGTHAILKHIWQHAIEWGLKNRDAFQFVHMCKASPLITNTTKEEVLSSHEFALKLLNDAFKKGELTRMDEGMFFTLFDGLYNSTINYLIQTGQKNKKKVIEQSFSIFWKGVSVSP